MEHPQPLWAACSRTSPLPPDIQPKSSLLKIVGEDSEIVVLLVLVLFVCGYLDREEECLLLGLFLLGQHCFGKLHAINFAFI